MDNKDTNQILKSIRIENKKTQAEIYKDQFSKSVYLKIESGERKLTIDEIVRIANKLGIELNELLALAPYETETEIKKLREEITDLLKATSSIRTKKRLKEIYFLLKKRNKLNLEWLNLYLFFAMGFSESSNTIKKPSENDLDYLKEVYADRTFFTFIDYKIYLNAIIIYGLEKCIFLEDKLFPVVFKNLRNFEFISTVFLAYSNMISLCVQQSNYKLGFKYLKDALKFENREIDYFSKTQFLYLEELLYYIQFTEQKNSKKALESLINAHNYVSFIEKLGDTRKSKTMYDEIGRITSKTDNLAPISYGFVTEKPNIQIQDIGLLLNNIPPKKIE